MAFLSMAPLVGLGFFARPPRHRQLQSTLGDWRILPRRAGRTVVLSITYGLVCGGDDFAGEKETAPRRSYGLAFLAFRAVASQVRGRVLHALPKRSSSYTGLWFYYRCPPGQEGPCLLRGRSSSPCFGVLAKVGPVRILAYVERPGAIGVGLMPFVERFGCTSLLAARSSMAFGRLVLALVLGFERFLSGIFYTSMDWAPVEKDR